MNTYAALLVITIVGAGATMLIVKAINAATPTDYSNLDAVLAGHTAPVNGSPAKGP